MNVPRCPKCKAILVCEGGIPAGKGDYEPHYNWCPVCGWDDIDEGDEA